MGQWTEAIHTCASHTFGFQSLLPIQQLVIHNIMEAVHPQDDADYYHKQLIILPTGTGKSACFQIPAALIDGYVLIVYPLLSLIHDQLRRLRDVGLESHTLVGNMTVQETQDFQKSMKNRSIKCMLTNPETLQNPTKRALIRQYPPLLCVVDEAHCISKWGDTFRPSYAQLGSVFNALKINTIVAFTATASDQVISDINTFLFLDEPSYVLRGHANRENITYSSLYCAYKKHALVSLLSENALSTHQNIRTTGMHPVHTSFHAIQKPVIIFCPTRALCVSLALFLRDHLPSHNIFFYHAGLFKEEKRAIEEWFFHSQDGILVATCAYGMGVDKSNIRTVIHYEAYTDIENFLQETGRAGRDGNPAVSLLLLELTSKSLQQDASISCRRAYFMDALGLTMDSCSGCDICVQRNPILSQEYQWVIEMVCAYPWCFDHTQLCAMVMRTHYVRAKKGLAFLLEIAVSHAIQQLLTQHILVKGKMLWRHKLALSKEYTIDYLHDQVQ